MSLNKSIQLKYKPNKLGDIVGNGKSIEYIKNWLETYNEVNIFLKKNGLLKKSSKGRKKKLINVSEKEIEYSKRKGNLLVTGSHGCGKSSIISIILKEQKYEVINLNMLDSRIKIDTDLIAKLSVKNYTDDVDRKLVLLIDELESVITLNDKNAVSNIIKDNNFNRWMPIIIITNNQHNKQLNNTKKFSNETKIFTPFSSEISYWIRNICRNENINMEWDIINKFIEYCQHDMRKILIQLEEIKIYFGTTKVNNEMFTNFTTIMKKKDLDFDLYKATAKMLTNYQNIETCTELYETEKVLMPLMIHENYYKFIKGEEYTKILDNLSTGDILENYIYGEQNWDLIELHGYISCSIPSYYISQHSNGVKSAPLEFAADLNRTSVKKMNTKNIHKTNDAINCNSKENIRNKSIDEFIYMGEIINKINQNTNCKDNNNINTKDIIKINKLKNSKSIISKKKII